MKKTKVVPTEPTETKGVPYEIPEVAAAASTPVGVACITAVLRALNAEQEAADRDGSHVSYMDGIEFAIGLLSPTKVQTAEERALERQRIHIQETFNALTRANDADPNTTGAEREQNAEARMMLQRVMQELAAGGVPGRMPIEK